jgi:hypothetical protein
MSQDALNVGDMVMLENTAARVLRVREDLEYLGRPALRALADELLALVLADAAAIRAKVEEISRAFEEAL